MIIQRDRINNVILLFICKIYLYEKYEIFLFFYLGLMHLNMLTILIF